MFLALLNWADDDGVGTANPKELAAFAFPNDEEIDARKTTVFLREISRSFKVVFYTVGGRPYYALEDWHKNQKINNPAKYYKNPKPDKAETWLYQDECPSYSSPTIGLPEDYGISAPLEVGSWKLEVGNNGGPVQTNRPVSNARESHDGEEPHSYVGGSFSSSFSNRRSHDDNDRHLDRMGRPAMSLNHTAEPLDPPPPDRRIPTEAKAIVRAVLPDDVPHRIRWLCEIEVATLLNGGAQHDAVEATLREWFATDEKMHPGNIKYIHTKRIQRETQAPSLSPKEQRIMNTLSKKTNAPHLSPTAFPREITNGSE